MITLRELSEAHDLEAFRALCGDPGEMNRLVHEMRRLDVVVPATLECQAVQEWWIEWHEDATEMPTIETARGYLEHTTMVDSVLRKQWHEFREGYRLPVENLCRPDVPLDRLMSVVQAARAWTRRQLVLILISSGKGFEATLGIDRDGENEDRLSGFDLSIRLHYRHAAHAIIVAALAACIVYGETG